MGEIITVLQSVLDPLIEEANRLYASLPLVLLALVFLVLFWTVGAILSRQRWLFSKVGKNVLLQGLARQLTKILFVLAGVLIALEILNLTYLIGALAGAAGVAGLALGFAFREIIENYLAGVLLGVQSPFTIGDWVAVGDIQGSVMRLTTRDLVLMSLEGNHIRVPNSQVFKSVIQNFTRNPLRAFVLAFGIGPEEDLESVEEVGISALKEMRGVLHDPPPAMRIEELGESTVNVVFAAWVDQERFDYLKVRSEAIRLVKDALDDAQISLPEPTSTVHLRRLDPDAGGGVEPPARRRRKPRREALHADVDREQHLDRQIEADARKSGESNLLG